MRQNALVHESAQRVRVRSHTSNEKVWYLISAALDLQTKVSILFSGDEKLVLMSRDLDPFFETDLNPQEFGEGT